MLLYYKYPRIKNYLRFKQTGDNVAVYDSLEEYETIVSYDTYCFMKRLDGKTHPYLINCSLSNDDVDYLLDKLRDEDLLRECKFLQKDVLSLLFTVFIPKKPKKNARLLSLFLNQFLCISFIPILIGGIICFANADISINYNAFWPGFIIGSVFGLVLHESAHAMAAIANKGGRFFEAGIGLEFLVIPVAYCLIDVKGIKSKLDRIQVYLAGIELNLTLCGLMLIGATHFTQAKSFLFFAALANGVMGTLNLCCCAGLDGKQVLNEVVPISHSLFEIIFDKNIRIRILRTPQGKATIIASCIVSVLELALPVIFITNLIGIASIIR